MVCLGSVKAWQNSLHFLSRSNKWLGRSKSGIRLGFRVSIHLLILQYPSPPVCGRLYGHFELI